MFIYSDTNKRYHTYSYYLKKKFGKKVIKVSLNGGFTCPNKDGTKGFGGCSYCSENGSGDFGGKPSLTIAEQFKEVRNSLKNKWNDALYIAYFQANTNTYAPLSVLKQKFEAALAIDNVVGLSISTRPDCISSETLDYLTELNERTELIVELGLQTVYDKTAERINRCHSYDDFTDCLERLSERNIKVCVHLINGLPGETREMMLNTVRTVSKLGIHSVKLHLLHILEGTKLAEEFKKEPFKVLGQDEYVNLICDQLELLPPSVVIQRITGDGDKNKLIAPLWSNNKRGVLNAIDKEMARRNAYQGDKYEE